MSLSKVQAFPPLPSSFYGTVKVDGGNLPEGTLVEALIAGQVFSSANTQIYEGDSVYQMIIPGDDSSTQAVEGGLQGDIVYFRYNGIFADQTAIWQSGTNTELNLVFSVGDGAPTSTLTFTPDPTQTEGAPSDTPTPKQSPEPTRTGQPTTAEVKTVTLTPTSSETESNRTETPLIPEESRVPTEEFSNIEKDDVLVDETENVSLSSKTMMPTSTELSNYSENESSLTWLFIGIPSLILLSVAGIWFYRSRTGRKNDLL